MRRLKMSQSKTGPFTVWHQSDKQTLLMAEKEQQLETYQGLFIWRGWGETAQFWSKEEGKIRGRAAYFSQLISNFFFFFFLHPKLVEKKALQTVDFCSAHLCSSTFIPLQLWHTWMTAEVARVWGMMATAVILTKLCWWMTERCEEKELSSWRVYVNLIKAWRPHTAHGNGCLVLCAVSRSTAG